MLTRNPTTGGTIRLIRSDSSVWKNQKTLVWMKQSPDKTSEANRWLRWDIAIEGVAEDLLTWNPSIIVIKESTEDVMKFLGTQQAKDTRFLLLSSKVAESIGDSQFKKFGLGNIMCLEEFTSMYPFLGSDWDGSTEDALICASIVFRYQRLIGVSPGHSRLSDVILNPIELRLIGSSDADAKPPEPLVLIQQYYKPKETARAKEIDKCLKQNLENPLIDKLYLFSESMDYKLPKSDKLVLIHKKDRITYADCIQLVQERIGKGHIVAFANADIYLDLTWRFVWTTDLHDICMALLRWEDGPEPTLYGPRSDSQDTWVLHTDSILERKWNLEPFKIQFGTAGCDNAILPEFLRQKFRIVNPAMTLRTLHVHATQIRHYDPTNIVDRPIYMYVDPTGIHELNPIVAWDSWAPNTVKHVPLDRPLRATTAKTLGIFCSQINRDPSFSWSVDGTNTYCAPVDQDHEIQMEGGAFVSPHGLVYRHTGLCVGKTEKQKELWSENQISHLMPAQHTASMMAFPLDPTWVEEASLYTLYYLSRVIKQHQLTPEASFWCKQSTELLAAFKLFNWKKPRGHLLHFSEQSQAFADKVVGRTAHTVRLFPDDIEALRTNLFESFWVPTISETAPLVIVVDEKQLTETLVAELSELYKKRHEVRILHIDDDAYVWAKALSGASRVILSSSVKNLKPSWAWLWLAPKGCKVLELQEEREPSDSLVHLCAAADMEWTLLQYPRATPDGLKKIILREVAKWFQVNTALVLPLVVVPPKSMKFGFFGHKGDSFRELIDMWAEKGYIEKKEDPIATQCWLEGVGKTLLYDRPTWEWLEKSSEAEQNYKVCLAGNPAASEKPNTQPWIFWPRQPRLVERLAASTLEKGFNDRSDLLVFYGRVENDKQGAYRQDISGWQELCTKFSMPIGSKEPYALGPEEYLLALQGAKYGLCLRGYGPKCNREIELLAMGTVPLVTPGVDYSGYAEPLIDGVHVICVSNAEDARVKMADISESMWITMSKAGYEWWKRNASAEGSWQRTHTFI
uniref:Uncharacterized protein n=1 Tax=viral metagenome TaxID=1070528 RepID=A0A6C0K326_9ZZZZ